MARSGKRVKSDLLGLAEAQGRGAISIAELGKPLHVSEVGRGRILGSDISSIRGRDHVCVLCEAWVNPRGICYECESRLRYDLGIPEREDLVGAHLSGESLGARWAAFRLRYVYSLAKGLTHWKDRSWPLSAALRPESQPGADGPYYVPPEEWLVYFLWRQIISKIDGAGRLERTFVQGDGLRMDLCGLEQMSNHAEMKSEIDMLIGASALFLDGSPRGRPPGSLSMPDFPIKLAGFLTNERDAGRWPTQIDAADALSMHRSTFRRHVQAFGVNWRGLRAAYRP